MRGGNRAGPAPDPNAIRRDRPSDQATWTTLPSHRPGPAPAWPMGTPTPRESDVWAKEWARPQAVMWEANGQTAEVAVYVRTLVEAERREASVALRTLLLRQQEALGLSLPGLARNRWRIGTSSTMTTEATKRQHDRRPASTIKDRFPVIEGGKPAS